MTELDFVFSDMLKPKRPIGEIIAEVAAYLSVTPEELLSTNRARVLVRGRQFVMWKARREGHTLEAIGKATKRHHGTVHDGIQAIERIMARRQPVLANVREAA